MKKIIYVTIAIASIFTSCKKDDKESPMPTLVVKHTTTNNTLKEITRSDLYPENGYISGTISSSTTDGHPFAKYFIHQLDVELPTYSINANGHYVIHLGKADKFGSIGDDDRSTDITFSLNKNLIDVQYLGSLHTSIYVDSTSKYITKFNINQDEITKLKMTVTNVNFNLSTGDFKANYSIGVDGIYTSSAKSARITGEISTRLTQTQY